MTPAETLIAKAADRSAVFGVVGLGYVGLPLAVELATAGYRVLGFDINEKVVDAVNAGRSHVGDVPSEMLARFTAGGGITATTDMSRMPEADVVSICVPTPLSKTRDPDVSFVMAVAKSLGKTVRAAQAIVLESTTYPGTTRELLLPRLQEHGLKVGKDFFRAFSPERVDPGNSEWRTRNTPKVLGGRDGDVPAGDPGALRAGVRPSGACLLARGGGADEALGEHVPQREHRAGQ